MVFDDTYYEVKMLVSLANMSQRLTSFGDLFTEKISTTVFFFYMSDPMSVLILLLVIRVSCLGVSVFLGLNHLDHWTWTGPSDYQLDQMGCIPWTNSSWTKS